MFLITYRYNILLCSEFAYRHEDRDTGSFDSIATTDVSSRRQELVFLIEAESLFSSWQIIITSFTPWKINMEPENHLFEREGHLPNNLRSWVTLGDFDVDDTARPQLWAAKELGEVTLRTQLDAGDNGQRA